MANYNSTHTGEEIDAAVSIVQGAATANADEVLTANGLGGATFTPIKVPYLTTAPLADNPTGIKFVVLSSEPATYYNGYYYIITGV